MKSNTKKCKGTGKAKGFNGCDKPSDRRKYGLCPECYVSWLFNSKEGKEQQEKHYSSFKEKEITEKKKRYNVERKKEKLSVKKFGELKSLLQKEINTIARLIDKDQGCISCSHGWSGDFTQQANGSHYFNVGSYDNLRFHLDNIHKSCIYCNKENEGNKPEYLRTLINLYGQDYADYVLNLNILYPMIKLDKATLIELVPIARKIVRELKKGTKYTRKDVNDIMGIYK